MVFPVTINLEQQFIPSNYVFGYSSSDDITTVSNWQSSQQFDVPNGTYWFFAKSRINPNKYYAYMQVVNCDGGVNVCNFDIGTVVKKALTPVCNFTIGTVYKKTIAPAPCNFTIGTVYKKPITVAPSLTLSLTNLSFNTNQGVQSALQTVKLNGSNLPSILQITCPLGFFVKLSSMPISSFSNVMTLPTTSGALSNVGIDFCFDGSSTKSNQTISVSGTSVSASINASGAINLVGSNTVPNFDLSSSQFNIQSTANAFDNTALLNYRTSNNIKQPTTVKRDFQSWYYMFQEDVDDANNNNKPPIQIRLGWSRVASQHLFTKSSLGIDQRCFNANVRNFIRGWNSDPNWGNYQIGNTGITAKTVIQWWNNNINDWSGFLAQTDATGNGLILRKEIYNSLVFSMSVTYEKGNDNLPVSMQSSQFANYFFTSMSIDEEEGVNNGAKYQIYGELVIAYRDFFQTNMVDANNKPLANNTISVEMGIYGLWFYDSLSFWSADSSYKLYPYFNVASPFRTTQSSFSGYAIESSKQNGVKNQLGGFLRVDCGNYLKTSQVFGATQYQKSGTSFLTETVTLGGVSVTKRKFRTDNVLANMQYGVATDVWGTQFDSFNGYSYADDPFQKGIMTPAMSESELTCLYHYRLLWLICNVRSGARLDSGLTNEISKADNNLAIKTNFTFRFELEGTPEGHSVKSRYVRPDIAERVNIFCQMLGIYNITWWDCTSAAAPVYYSFFDGTKGKKGLPYFAFDRSVTFDGCGYYTNGRDLFPATFQMATKGFTRMDTFSYIFNDPNRIYIMPEDVWNPSKVYGANMIAAVYSPANNQILVAIANPQCDFDEQVPFVNVTDTATGKTYKCDTTGLKQDSTYLNAIQLQAGTRNRTSFRFDYTDIFGNARTGTNILP